MQEQKFQQFWNVLRQTVLIKPINLILLITCGSLLNYFVCFGPSSMSVLNKVQCGGMPGSMWRYARFNVEIGPGSVLRLGQVQC